MYVRFYESKLRLEITGYSYCSWDSFKGPNPKSAINNKALPARSFVLVKSHKLLIWYWKITVLSMQMRTEEKTLWKL